MAMKTCPSCGADVPSSAARCKECFHDFNEVKPRRTGPIALLAAFAAMAVVGAVTFWVISGRPVDRRILVDEATHSIIFTTQYRDGPETERLMWDDIGKLEHVSENNGTFEIAAIKLDGTRMVIHESNDKSLEKQAEVYAKMMEKPLTLVDNTRGFGKLD